MAIKPPFYQDYTTSISWDMEYTLVLDGSGYIVLTCFHYIHDCWLYAH